MVLPPGPRLGDPICAGINLLANNLKVPVVPMRIDGAFEVCIARRFFNRPERIRVYISKPVEFPAASDPQQIARMLEQRIAALGLCSVPADTA
jgi:1-acyl-sn-glycerol-3-phosphate acyltransferase